MHDSKNRIGHRDRIILIKVVKSMVYSKSEIELNTIHSQLKSHEVAKKYPQFLQHKFIVAKEEGMGSVSDRTY